MADRVKEFFANVQMRPNRVSGYVQDVTRDSQSGQQADATVRVDGQAIHVSLGVGSPNLAVGDRLTLEQSGTAAGADYHIADVASAARAPTGVYEILDETDDLPNGGTYMGGDLIVGSLFGGNTWHEYATGNIHHRVGNTIYALDSSAAPLVDAQRWSNGAKIIGQLARVQEGEYISSGAWLGLGAGVIKIGAGSDTRIAFNADGSGQLANGHIAWDTAGALTVGGWTITASTLAKGTAVVLDADNAAIAIKSPVFAEAGIQLQYNNGSPRFYVGNGADQYLKFDDNGLYMGGDGSGIINIYGGNIQAATITGVQIAQATISGDQIQNATITGAQITGATIAGANIQAATITGSNIANATIAGANIAEATIAGTNIQTGSITGANIQTGSIAGIQIADGAITGAKIATGTILASNIQAGTITADEIADLTITGEKIKNLTIAASQITNATITGAKIANATITGGNIANATITGSNLAGGTITGSNIAGATITAANIQAATITSSLIADSTITGAKIAATTIAAGNIAAGAIGTNQLAALAVTADKIAADAIDSKTITGATIRTAASGQRVEVSGGQLFGCDNSNVKQFYLDAASGGKAFAGGGAVVLDSTGIYIQASTSFADNRSLRFTYGSINMMRLQGSYPAEAQISSELVVGDLNFTGSVSFGSKALGNSGSSVSNYISATNYTKTAGISTQAFGNSSLVLLSADTLSLTASSITTTCSALVNNLNTDKLDGYHAGNASGYIPISNGTVCTNLNAQYLNGNPSSNFALYNHNHSGVYASYSHTHGYSTFVQYEYTILNGTAVAVGATTYWAQNYGVPSTALALVVRLASNWGSSTPVNNNNCTYLRRYGGSKAAVVARHYAVNIHCESSGIVNLNGGGWDVVQAGAATTSTYMEIVGYFI